MIGSFADTSPETGEIAGSLSWGPNQIHGMVDESMLDGYQVRLVDISGGIWATVGQVPKIFPMPPYLAGCCALLYNLTFGPVPLPRLVVGLMVTPYRGDEELLGGVTVTFRDFTTTSTTTTSRTTTSTTIEAARVSGAWMFYADGATQTQVSQASSKAIAALYGVNRAEVQVQVSYADVTVAANSSRLLAAGVAPRRLVGSWTVTYEVAVLGSILSYVESTGFSIASNSSAFASLLKTELISLGFSRAAALQSFSMGWFQAPTTEILLGQFLLDWANSTSTTVTSTTTTSTILHFLSLESAQFTNAFTILALFFDMPAKLNDKFHAGSKNPTCSFIFDATTIAKLGTQPACAFSWDRKSLQVTLGISASLKLGSLVVTRLDALVPWGNVAFMSPVPAFTGTVFSAEAPLSSKAVLVASPPSAQACTPLLFSTSQSSGSVGRSLAILGWSFGAQTSQPMVDVLRPALSAASASGSAQLRISAGNFSAAVAAVKASLVQNYPSTPVVLEIKVQVANWLGSLSNASAFVLLDKGEEPMPLLTPLTSTTLQVRNKDSVTLAVGTGSADTEACGGQSTAPEVIVLLWEFRSYGQGNLWSRVENSAWLKDLDRVSGVVKFAAFSFEPSTRYEFRATASYPSSSTSAALPSLLFDVTIGPRAPPVAMITGPAQTSDTCGFTVSAASSKDLSIGSTQVADFRYSWSCQPTNASMRGCGSLPNFASSSFNLTNGSGATGAEFIVPGAILAEGSYNFTVFVWRRNGSAAGPGVASFIVSLQAGAPPPITVIVPWSNGSYVSTQTGGNLGAAKAVVQAGSGCAVRSTWAWHWALVEAEPPSRILALLETTSSVNYATSQLILSTLDFKGQDMVPGSMYFYALLLSTSGTKVKAGSPSDLNAATSSGMQVSGSVPFIADGPPSLGMVSSSPLVGEAVVTAFSISTSAWNDEQPDDLSYAFYQFPVSSGIALAADGAGGILAKPAFSTPFIDWDNGASPSHWTRIGGRELRPWGSSSDLSDSMGTGISMPLGSYFLVCRARDVLGAAGSAMLLGPLVSQPAGGLSKEAATRALSATFASGDANSIMNAVSSVNSVAVSGDSADADAVTDAALSALQMAQSVMPTGPEAMQKMSSVVTDVVKVIKNKPALKKAATLISSVLSTALAEGVGQEDGDSLLGSVAAIGQGNLGTGGTDEGLEDAAAEMSERVSQLTAQLGAAAMKKVQVGATLTLSSLGPDGKGTEMALAKVDMAASRANGVSITGLTVPAAVLNANTSRRLATVSVCNAFNIQRTSWVSSNPYGWANSAKGLNSHVASNATVEEIQVKMCDDIIRFTNASAPTSVVVPLPGAGAAPSGYSLQPACAMWDGASRRWLSDSVAVQQPLTHGNKLTCLAYSGGGAYTAFWLPVPLLVATTAKTSVTTTSMTITTATSTSTSASVVASKTVVTAVDSSDSNMVLGVVLAGVYVVLSAFVLGLYCFCCRSKASPITPVDEEDMPSAGAFMREEPPLAYPFAPPPMPPPPILQPPRPDLRGTASVRKDAASASEFTQQLPPLPVSTSRLTPSQKMSLMPSQVVLPEGWVQKMSSKGKVYYWNKDLDLKSWEPPQDAQLALADGSTTGQSLFPGSPSAPALPPMPSISQLEPHELRVPDRAEGG